MSPQYHSASSMRVGCCVLLRPGGPVRSSRAGLGVGGASGVSGLGCLMLGLRRGLGGRAVKSTQQHSNVRTWRDVIFNGGV